MSLKGTKHEISTYDLDVLLKPVRCYGLRGAWVTMVTLALRSGGRGVKSVDVEESAHVTDTREGHGKGREDQAVCC